MPGIAQDGDGERDDLVAAPRPSLTLTYAPSANTTRTRAGAQNSQLTHTAAGSNGVLRAGGGTGLGERRPASAGGMGEAGSALEMGRL